ncbi:MAG TPA: PAS domain S-box protein [Burkholderiales bacterium]|nr:PAS domain S-box protein [Burkholderiales bacterium]
MARGTRQRALSAQGGIAVVREPKFGSRRGRQREPVRILLLEDDPDYAALVRAQLRSMAFVESRLDVVGTLSDAVAKLANERFGLVLADLNLPDSTGEHTVAALADAAEQPIIVLTADQDPTLRARCIECGAFDFLTKDGLTAGALERLVRLAAMQASTLSSLRESEARKTAILDASLDAVVTIGQDGRIAEWSAAAEKLFGYSRTQAVGRDMAELVVPPEFHAAHRAGLARAVAGEPRLAGKRVELPALRADGTRFEAEIAIVRIAASQPAIFTGTVRDITERKRAEAALRESEERFRLTFELAGSGIAHVALDGAFLRVNRKLCEILGYSEQELIGRSVKEISHPDDRDVTDAARARLRAGEIESVRMEKRYLRHDGATVWVDLTVALARGPEGALLHEISIMEDISQRKAAEAALKESEARFRSLTELSADFYWETDAEHRVLRTMHGVNHRPILANQVGKQRWELPSTRPDSAGWAEHRALLEAHLPFRDFELARIDFEGLERHLSLSGGPVFDAAGRFVGYRGVGQEITRRKQEEALLRLEHEVTHRLAEAQSAASGLQAVMQAIGEAQGWPCGRYFSADDEAGVLRFVEGWGLQIPAVQDYIAKSRATTYARGKGLSGIVWRSGEPLWVNDVHRDTRSSGSSRAWSDPGSGLKGGAFVFPVILGGRTLGVMSFSSAAREPDARLVQALGVIGRQIGQFVQRRHAEAQRHEMELQFRRTFELAGTGLAHIGLDRRFIRVNRRLCEIFGYPEAELLGRMAKEFSHPEDIDVINEQRPRLYAGEIDAVRGEKRYLRKDGSVVWLAFTVAVERDSHGRALYEITVYDDITERKRAEERQGLHLRYQERVARFGQSALVKSEPAELVEKAVQAVLEALAAEAVAYLETDPGAGGFVLRTVVGLADASVHPGPVICARGDPILQVMLSGTRVLTEGVKLPLAWARELRSAALIPVRGDEKVRGVLCVCYKQPGAFGAEELNFVEATASVLSTALQRIDSEGRLAYLAQFDPLTGLPNRTLLADRFSQMIVQASRRDSALAVLFIDLDEFKMVNDTLGHAGGDALLKEVAVRLQSTVRTGDTVARISGDEFAIVLADLARPDDAALVAQKVIDGFSTAMEVHGKEVFVTASVGIAAFPGDGTDAEALIGAADAAMYRAKQSGRNAYQFFTAEINQRSRARAQMGSELRRALEREEFALVYQPKYYLADGRPSGAEALLRWRHPERGTVSPAEFIPVLEETGLIVPVGEWVMRRACADLKAWLAGGLSIGPVSVNLSARQFRLPDLHERIKALVAAADVDAALIELEITESQLMQDPDHAIRVMRALREAGMRIAIDDFGTGYSSLAYLTRFPVGSLKIDRSFVHDMAKDKNDATIVRTIIEMAHSLGFTVVAEGVETEEQAAFLRLLRCEQAQGFLFARPMPAEEFARFCVA